MNTRFQHSEGETARMNTAELRKNFIVDSIMENDVLSLTYTHYDRMIIGGIMCSDKRTELSCPAELKASYFLERRELGIINVGGKGQVEVDGKKYELDKLDSLYVGKGSKKIMFSGGKEQPAAFYLLSAPAHAVYETRRITKSEASPVELGDNANSNKRTIYKYIHNDGAQSCQLVMGLTILQAGSVWNSVPPHTHTRRMEVYFYFDVPADHRVFHFMGRPQETRHVVLNNHEAVISPPWSVHFGCGTSNYGFIWGMAGENKEFTDMDPAPVKDLK